MYFEWDEKKNKTNIKKHGISFEEACQIFTDPHLLLIPDPCDSEERWNAIGFVETILFVVYTERNDDTLRIISARKANKEEINGYKNNDFRRN